MDMRLMIGEDFKKAIEGIVKADGMSVESGHFLDSGLHHSGMTYPALMMQHHVGSDRITSRPVLSITAFRFDGSPVATKHIGDWLEGKIEPTMMMDRLGQEMEKLEVGIMGNPAYLPVTNNPTPLIDTADLVSQIKYKVKKNKE